MVDEVKVCVDAKVNFIKNSFDIPSELQSTLESFIQEVNALGEKCQIATEFEERFISEGLSEIFQNIIIQSPQKTHKMTKEEKKGSLKTAAKVLNESKGELLAHDAKRAAERLTSKLSEEATRQRYDQMEEDETLRDYLNTKNTIENIGVFARLFGRKKK